MKRIHIVSSVACALGRVLLIAQLGAVVSTCLGQTPGSLDLSFDPTAGGTFQLELAGTPGVYSLEVSTNLHNWSTAGSVTNGPSGRCEFAAEAGNDACRFYRAIGRREGL